MAGIDRIGNITSNGISVQQTEPAAKTEAAEKEDKGINGLDADKIGSSGADAVTRSIEPDYIVENDDIYAAPASNDLNRRIEVRTEGRRAFRGGNFRSGRGFEYSSGSAGSMPAGRLYRHENRDFGNPEEAGNRMPEGMGGFRPQEGRKRVSENKKNTVLGRQKIKAEKQHKADNKAKAFNKQVSKKAGVREKGGKYFVNDLKNTEITAFQQYMVQSMQEFYADNKEPSVESPDHEHWEKDKNEQESRLLYAYLEKNESFKKVYNDWQNARKLAAKLNNDVQNG